jgi:ATP-dependent DNA helicase RecQ
MASRTRPQLIRSLGEHIAAVGRMPLLGSIAYADETTDTRVPRSNRAQRLRALHGALTVPPTLAGALASAGGPVLLLDDLADTGWTLAVATRLLHRAGAEGVFPLVLAVQG